MRSILLLLHLSGVIVWVGGMFFAHFCLRPVAALQLPPPQRLPSPPMPRQPPIPTGGGWGDVLTGNGRHWWTFGGADPVAGALANCRKAAEDCVLYAVGDEVVWPK